MVPVAFEKYGVEAGHLEDALKRRFCVYDSDFAVDSAAQFEQKPKGRAVGIVDFFIVEDDIDYLLADAERIYRLFKHAHCMEVQRTDGFYY